MNTNLLTIHHDFLAAHAEQVDRVIAALRNLDDVKQNFKYTEPLTEIQKHVGHDPNLPFQCRAKHSEAYNPVAAEFSILLDAADNYANELIEQITAAETEIQSRFNVRDQRFLLCRKVVDSWSATIKTARRNMELRNKMGFPWIANFAEAFVEFRRAPVVAQSQLS